MAGPEEEEGKAKARPVAPSASAPREEEKGGLAGFIEMIKSLLAPLLTTTSLVAPTPHETEAAPAAAPAAAAKATGLASPAAAPQALEQQGAFKSEVEELVPAYKRLEQQLEAVQNQAKSVPAHDNPKRKHTYDPEVARLANERQKITNEINEVRAAELDMLKGAPTPDPRKALVKYFNATLGAEANQSATVQIANAEAEAARTAARTGGGTGRTPEQEAAWRNQQRDELRRQNPYDNGRAAVYEFDARIKSGEMNIGTSPGFGGFAEAHRYNEKAKQAEQIAQNAAATENRMNTKRHELAQPVYQEWKKADDKLAAQDAEIAAEAKRVNSPGQQSGFDSQRMEIAKQRQELAMRTATKLEALNKEQNMALHSGALQELVKVNHKARIAGYSQELDDKGSVQLAAQRSHQSAGQQRQAAWSEQAGEASARVQGMIDAIDKGLADVQTKPASRDTVAQYSSENMSPLLAKEFLKNVQSALKAGNGSTVVLPVLNESQKNMLDAVAEKRDANGASFSQRYDHLKTSLATSGVTKENMKELTDVTREIASLATDTLKMQAPDNKKRPDIEIAREQKALVEADPTYKQLNQFRDTLSKDRADGKLDGISTTTNFNKTKHETKLEGEKLSDAVLAKLSEGGKQAYKTVQEAIKSNKGIDKDLSAAIDMLTKDVKHAMQATAKDVIAHAAPKTTPGMASNQKSHDGPA